MNTSKPILIVISIMVISGLLVIILWFLCRRTYIELLEDEHRKTEPVQLEKIDIPIIYINMDKSTNRRKFIENQLRGVKNVIRVPGVVVTDEEMKKYPEGTTKGVVGCYLAHINAMKEISKNGWDRALILEDDACLRLSSRWTKKLSELKYPIWLSQGTTAYIIDPKTANDFYESSKDRLDLQGGIDNHMVDKFGDNPMNTWQSYKYIGWPHEYYIYPYASKFESHIQVNNDQMMRDSKRALKIIKKLDIR